MKPWTYYADRYLTPIRVTRAYRHGALERYIYLFGVRVGRVDEEASVEVRPLWWEGQEGSE